jgi:hypothetical protein
MLDINTLVMTVTPKGHFVRIMLNLENAQIFYLIAVNAMEVYVVNVKADIILITMEPAIHAKNMISCVLNVIVHHALLVMVPILILIVQHAIYINAIIV